MNDLRQERVFKISITDNRNPQGGDFETYVAISDTGQSEVELRRIAIEASLSKLGETNPAEAFTTIVITPRNENTLVISARDVEILQASKSA